MRSEEPSASGIHTSDTLSCGHWITLVGFKRKDNVIVPVFQKGFKGENFAGRQEKSGNEQKGLVDNKNVFSE